MRILSALIFLTALLPFYAITNTFGIFGENTAFQNMMQQRLQSPLMISGLGISLYAMDYFVFIKRKSFLN